MWDEKAKEEFYEYLFEARLRQQFVERGPDLSAYPSDLLYSDRDWHQEAVEELVDRQGSSSISRDDWETLVFHKRRLRDTEELIEKLEELGWILRLWVPEKRAELEKAVEI